MANALAIRLPDIEAYLIEEKVQPDSYTKVSICKHHQEILSEVGHWCETTLGYLPDIEVKMTRNFHTDSILSAIVLKFNSDADRTHFLMSHDTTNIIVIDK